MHSNSRERERERVTEREREKEGEGEEWAALAGHPSTLDAGVKVNEIAEHIAMEVLARSNCTTKNCVFEMQAETEMATLCKSKRHRCTERERERKSERKGEGESVACKMKG